jgi:hypothetical protein
VRVRGGAAAVFLVTFGWSLPARSQLRWDLGAQAGVTDRLPVAGAPSRTPGPSGEIHAHVALYPMLRAGPYAAFDLSPVDSLPARRVYAGGLRAKITPPILPSPWRAWAFAGVGVAYAYTPGSMALKGDGTFLPELPVGIGLGLRVTRSWELCAEIAERTNLAAFGKIGARESPPANAAAVFPGDDLLAVSFSVGVNLDL